MALDDPGPFRVRVYDKSFAFLFQLGDCAVSVSPRHLAKGTGSITVPLAHRRFAAMFATGVRVTVDYLTGKDRTDEASWLRIMSGPLWAVTIAESEVPRVGKVCVFGIEDDLRILWQMLGWANPAAAIGSQTANAYDARSGAAETVIKAYVTANATRLSLPLTCATNLSRGATVKGNIRFENLGDTLIPLAQAGGLGISVQQVGAGLVLDVYEPTDRTARVLTEESGTVRSWALTRVGPSATRAVIAAQGEGTTRNFSSATPDTTSETAWGTKAETFVDARDTADSATLVQRGALAVSDGGPRAGYSLTLAETDVVRYGPSMVVGDLIAFQVLPGLTLADTLTECTLTHSAQDGFTVTPQVGPENATANPNRQLAQAITRVATWARKLRSGL